MESGFQAPDVRASLADAWQLVRQRFSLPETGLFYDYLSATGLDHLPTREEVLRQVPDRYGYGTGQEDCMISAGTLLDFLVSCAEASLLPEDRLRQDAAFLVQGISRCALAHGVPGFLARAVCREDFSLVYPATSRDQYTMAVYGLWRLLRSPFPWGQTRDIARRILVAIATRMEETVRPENDFDSLQINGERDPLGLRSRRTRGARHGACAFPRPLGASPGLARHGWSETALPHPVVLASRGRRSRHPPPAGPRLPASSGPSGTSRRPVPPRGFRFRHVLRCV